MNLNNAAGLRRTIESVISQTATDIEYIVIDGGSTDGSEAVIRSYQDKLAYWVSEPDRGIYQAMNKGIVRATGEYCQFLNSGDYLSGSDVTERMLANMPDCSILYGNEIRYVHGKVTIEKSYAGRPITLLDMYRSTLFHSSAYIRRILFDKYGLYDEGLKIVSDWKFYLITVGLNNETVAYRDINLVWFDMSGISSSNTNLDKKERLGVLKQVLPGSIQADYQEFSIDMIITRRFKKNRLVWFFFLNLYRVLFRIDKLYAK